MRKHTASLLALIVAAFMGVAVFMLLFVVRDAPTTREPALGDVYEICQVTLDDGSVVGTAKLPCADATSNRDGITIKYEDGATYDLRHCTNVALGQKCFITVHDTEYDQVTGSEIRSTLKYHIDAR